jgi:hypothetical protein
MSTWSWKQKIWESELSATTKIVLQALASHLNDFGDPMFPSQWRNSVLSVSAPSSPTCKSPKRQGGLNRGAVS